MPLREARREDIRRIVEMLADDEVARGREDFSGDMAATTLRSMRSRAIPTTRFMSGITRER